MRALEGVVALVQYDSRRNSNATHGTRDTGSLRIVICVTEDDWDVLVHDIKVLEVNRRIA